jgi:hypothetical protein
MKHHDIAEILLKLVLNTIQSINQSINQPNMKNTNEQIFVENRKRD